MSLNSDKKIELKLHEDNSLSFRLSIEGTVSDPDLASPRFRFTITEIGEDRGWIFPAKKEADDVVTVSIPAPLKTGFKSGRVYKGTLEVILGRLYFSPAEVQLEFATPLEIQAEIAVPASVSKITETATVQPEDASFDEEEIMSVISQDERKPQMATPSTKKGASRTMVSEKRLQAALDQKRLQASSTKQRSASLSANQPAKTQKHPNPAKDSDAQKEQLKARLLNMFKTALKD